MGGVAACRAPASEIRASLNECLLPPAKENCGRGFEASGKWGAGVQHWDWGNLRAPGGLPLWLPREPPVVAGCQSQNLGACWGSPGSHTLKRWPISVETGKTGSARRAEPRTPAPSSTVQRGETKVRLGLRTLPPRAPQRVVPTRGCPTPDRAVEWAGRLPAFLPPSIHLQGTLIEYLLYT